MMQLQVPSLAGLSLRGKLSDGPPNTGSVTDLNTVQVDSGPGESVTFGIITLILNLKLLARYHDLIGQGRLQFQSLML